MESNPKEIHRWWDPIAGFSLVALVFFSAYSIQITQWTLDLGRITILAVLSAFSGILIGQSGFSRGFSILLTFLYGIGIFLWQFVFSLSFEYLWSDRLAIVVERFRSVFTQIAANVPLDDGILFLALMAILFIVLSISFGYVYTRNGKPVLHLSFLSLIFLIVQILTPFYRRKPLVIILYCLFLVLFIGRMQYLRLRKNWDRGEFHTDREAAAYLLRIVIIASTLFALFAWLVPFAAEKLSLVDEPTYFLSRKNSDNERINNLLFPLRSLTVKFGEGMFAETIPLGLSRSLDDSLVFKVNPPILDDFYGRFYWKARTYSIYANGYWKNEGLEFSTVNEVDLSEYIQYAETLSDYLFTYEVNRRELITPQITAGIDRNVEVAYFSIDESRKDFIDFVDYQVIRQGDKISVLGGYYAFDINKISNGKQDYPDWIKERYLSVPDELAARLRALTEKIVVGRSSTFDKVSAVTSFLRNNYAYQDAIEIPKGKEPIDWFLFEGREGFCNYFSTSEVLMLRSIGIPARFVVGYSQGSSAGSVYRFEVSKKDSHSWVEVFFPDMGWIIFEATPSEPSLIYFEQEFSDMEMTKRDSVYLGRLFEVGVGAAVSLDNFEDDLPGDQALQEQEIAKNLSWVWIAIPLVLMSVFYFIYRRFFLLKNKSFILPTRWIEKFRKQNKKIPDWVEKLSQYESLSILEKQFHNIVRIAEKTNIITQENLTPNEFLEKLSSILKNEKLIIQSFSTEYHKILFGPQSKTALDTKLEEYDSIIKSLLLHWVQEKIKKLSRLLKRKAK